jgi:hypothetical protein
MGWNNEENVDLMDDMLKIGADFGDLKGFCGLRLN